MESNLTPAQHGFLRQLASFQGDVLLKELKPKPSASPADRTRLLNEGLIVARKQKRALTFTATEKGRAWVAAHPEDPKPPKVSKPVKASTQSAFPTPAQRLFLLRLAFMPADAPDGGTAGLLKAPERALLVQERWVVEQTRGRAKVFSLSDAGWKWLDEHLGDPMTGGGLAPTVVWDVLARVSTYLKANGHRLADLIRAKPPSVQPPSDESPPPTSPNGEINAAVREACLRLGGGHNVQRIRLAALRRELNEWGKAALDEALLGLSLSGHLVLEALDDPREITQEDRDAVFRTPSREVRHLVYWTQN